MRVTGLHFFINGRQLETWWHVVNAPFWQGSAIDRESIASLTNLHTNSLAKVQSSWAVTISSDRSRVIIGAPINGANEVGRACICDWSLTSTDWVQAGQDIDGGEASGTVLAGRLPCPVIEVELSLVCLSMRCRTPQGV